MGEGAEDDIADDVLKSCGEDLLACAWNARSEHCRTPSIAFRQLLFLLLNTFHQLCTR